MTIYTRRENVPHSTMRARAHGTLLVIQPYLGTIPSADPLTMNLESGSITLSEERISLESDYVAVYGVLGVLKLPKFSAVAAITAAEKVAIINGASFYRITATQVFTSRGAPPKGANDARVLSLFKEATNPNGAGRGLYFSPDFNATVTQQFSYNNDDEGKGHHFWKTSNPDFWWNEDMTKPLRDVEAHKFVLPCMLGFVRQIADSPLRHGSKTDQLTVSIIARRYKKRPGTRHWRRGVDKAGDVANFAETEQIIETESGLVSAFVQTRGSIPLCWSQVPNAKYKPPTVIAPHKLSLAPFHKHAAKMSVTYENVVSINLVNSHGSEGQLTAEYTKLVKTLDNENFKLVSFDFHKECGKLDYGNLKFLWQKLSDDFGSFGVFTKQQGGKHDDMGHALSHSSAEHHVLSQQHGVFRTNCIDCLDRTNVVQALFARKSLESQLARLKMMPPGGKTLAEAFPKLQSQFNVMWADHGDMLSRQYAGTGALKSGFTRTGERTLGGMVDDGLKSIVRYYLNNYEDGIKQDAMDLFSGTYPLSLAKNAKPKKHASGAIPLIAGCILILLSLQMAVAAPWSERITFIYHAVIPFAIALFLIAVVAGLGSKACCRPQLCPQATQVWLSNEPESHVHGTTKPYALT